MTGIATPAPLTGAAWPLGPDALVLVVQAVTSGGSGLSDASRATLETVAIARDVAIDPPHAPARPPVSLELARFDRHGAPARQLVGATLATALAECARDAPSIGLLVVDPDATVLAACLASLCADASGPAAIAIPRDAGHLAGCWDRLLFDWGYVRLKPGACGLIADAADAYVRSDLLTDLSLLREPSSNAVSMQTLGQNGRFANQLWQYAFLTFYGLRNNCRVQTPRWIGQMLYGFKAEPPDPSFARQAFTVFTGVERHLWTMSDPPVNLDFFGYFQEIPVSWRRHRQLLRRLFTAQPMFVELIERWFKRTVPPDATVIGIHVRRGDYSYFDHNSMPWFRPIPTEWYDAFLQELWPTLERPVLFIATDDAAAVVPHFAQYEPFIVPDNEIAIPELAFLPDFWCMQRSAILAASNSSFSRMAALLADDRQIAYLPNMKTQRFERYDAWQDEDFWARFEA
ncbi:MAG: hypothetical protein WDO24_02075 [Pseudomonadota bacterium]